MHYLIMTEFEKMIQTIVFYELDRFDRRQTSGLTGSATKYDFRAQNYSINVS